MSQGFQCKLLNNDPTDFTGLGKKTTEGKCKIPLCIELLESGLVLPGAVSSHEVDSDHPLLLSQNCQAKLGMVKNMRQGIMEFEDYPGQQVEVVRQARTGLFMIRIDNLDRDTIAIYRGTENSDVLLH